MLFSSQLCIDEKELYDAVLRWGRARLVVPGLPPEGEGTVVAPSTLAEVVAVPLRLVRFSQIPVGDLMAIRDARVADADDVWEGLAFQADPAHTVRHTKRDPSQFEMRRRKWVCVYDGTPFDEGDAIHRIATCGGSKAWSNPHTAGLVKVSMSSKHPCCAEHEMKLVGLAACTSGTQDVVNSWVTLDLGPSRSMHVNHYSLRHGWVGCNCMRNWELQARTLHNDSWVTILK